MNRSAIILAAWLALSPVAVANRCAAEASFAVRECACTVVNRIAEGWNPLRVLSAYYAPSITASEAQVQAVADVLDGSAVCDKRLYFMWSDADIAYLGLEAYTPALVVTGDDGRKVSFYSRWFRREQ